MSSIGVWLCLSIVSFQLISASVVNDTNNLLNHLADLDNWKPPKSLVNKCPYYVSGFDLERRPILIVEIGKCPVRSAVEKGGNDLLDLTKYILQAFRKVQLGARPYFNDNDIDSEGTVVIFDWEGFSYSQLIHRPTTQFLLYQFKAFEKVQEHCAYGYFLNANAAAAQLFQMARPILGSVMERVEVYGTQKKVWIPRLLRRIPKDQLPAWYGGEQQDFKPIAVYG